jgi:hypothetical protein
VGGWVGGKLEASLASSLSPTLIVASMAILIVVGPRQSSRAVTCPAYHRRALQGSHRPPLSSGIIMTWLSLCPMELSQQFLYPLQALVTLSLQMATLRLTRFPCVFRFRRKKVSLRHSHMSPCSPFPSKFVSAATLTLGRTEGRPGAPPANRLALDIAQALRFTTLNTALPAPLVLACFL